MPVQKTCQQCSVTFSIPLRRSEAVKYCSRTCKTEAGYSEHDCPACGVRFKRKKSDGARTDVKYCSKECDLKSRKGRTHAVDPDAVIHTRTCEFCKSEFKVTAQRKDSARFCSAKCKFESPEYRKQASYVQVGEKHWRWAGGIYKNDRGYIQQRGASVQSQYQHRNVIFDAMIAANPDHPFIIEIHGKKKLNPEIEVHHIDRNRENNALDNLLAVTKYAHSQIHHRNKKPNPWECWPSDPEKW